jgi:pimeloyl-ACP methyl ester carboxylesterase
MQSFAEFLIGMGYPENRIRDPGDGAFSRSPYDDSEHQAGEIAWYYEHEGVRPMLIGHSQGGIQAVKILHELAGTFGPTRHVFNPLTQELEGRTTIVDPLSGRERPVVGVSVSYTAVVGTGGWALVLPVHWKVVNVIRAIPDTVDDFTGYRIELDFFAWDAPGLEAVKTFHAEGKAKVRNVTLPVAYSHVFVPATSQLAETPAMRTWINAFDPDDEAGRAPLPDRTATNVMFAADVWHSIKKHWCLEAQQLIRARRAALATR